MAALAVMATDMYAQTRKVQNKPYIDNRRFHYGFLCAVHSYMWFIAIAYTTATLFCFLVPNGQDLRPAELPRQNICTWILQMTWAADNNANVFPSVHVLGVVAAISAMWHSPKLKRVWQIAGTVWFVIIAASTLLVKQHAFIDLAAALVWGAVVYVIVYVIIGHKRDKMGLRCGVEDPGREDGHDHSPDPRI